MNNESLSRKEHRPRHNKHGASLQPLGPLKIHQLCPYISVEITILEMQWAYERTLQVIGWKVSRRTAAVHPLYSSGSFGNRWKESPGRFPAPIWAANNNIGRLFSWSPDTLCVRLCGPAALNDVTKWITSCWFPSADFCRRFSSTMNAGCKRGIHHSNQHRKLNKWSKFHFLVKFPFKHVKCPRNLIWHPLMHTDISDHYLQGLSQATLPSLPETD